MLTSIEKYFSSYLLQDHSIMPESGFMTFTEPLLAADLILVWIISASEFCVRSGSSSPSNPCSRRGRLFPSSMR